MNSGRFASSCQAFMSSSLKVESPSDNHRSICWGHRTVYSAMFVASVLSQNTPQSIGWNASMPTVPSTSIRCRSVRAGTVMISPLRTIRAGPRVFFNNIRWRKWSHIGPIIIRFCWISTNVDAYLIQWPQFSCAFASNMLDNHEAFNIPDH